MSVSPSEPAVAPSALEAPEIAGYRSLWAAAPPPVAGAFGIEHADVDGVHVAAAAALGSHRLTTHALGYEGGRDSLGRVAAFYRRKGLTGHLGLREGHREERRLEAMGARRGHVWTKFARGVEPAVAPATDLEIRRVSRSEAAAMGAVITSAFELPDGVGAWFAALPERPGWHCLGAFDGPDLVGTGSLFAHCRVGWVTWGATRRADRGRGAQGALFAARIALARDLGLSRVVCETGAPGPEGPGPSYRNILRSGFTPVYRRRFWLLRS